MEKVKLTEREIEDWIDNCQARNHIQQVAYSTYHKALTQVCFTCNVCRTSLPELEQKKMKENQSLKEVIQ